MTAVVRTTCPYCGVGCGVLATPRPDGSVAVKGDPEHPANFGRLCSKGTALGETLSLDDRLLYPEIGGRRASWDEALDLVADKFGSAIAEHGPDSVALYVSGQLLTEDYYIANKLMKGFVGSANIDTNSRLCMASSVAGHRRAFGADTVPGTYEDLELADLVVLTGSNLAWCHPVLYQRLAAAKEKRPQMKVVVIDPRRTMTADIADMHLAVKPDGDVALFTGLLAHLGRLDAIDWPYVEAHTTGFAEAAEAAKAVPFDEIVRQTGLEAGTLCAFYSLFSETEKTVTVYSQGVNQSSSGTDKVNAIINCHLATGRIGRPGMGPFSVTGQPNAMGGREVGGLANMLAAHMALENPDHRDLVQRFWASPVMADKPGLKAVDMFRAVADGSIKALWIMATNPVDSLPEADVVEAALRACPFVVVSDMLTETDTVRHAHVKLPATAWGEKEGTVTNSERRISRQRAFLPAPGEARPDWWQLAEVAKRMGFGVGFSYDSPAEIFAEHAALSAFENGGARDFDIGAYAEIDGEGYDALAPFQWPAPAGGAGFCANESFLPAAPADPHPQSLPSRGRKVRLRMPSSPSPLRGGASGGGTFQDFGSAANTPPENIRFFAHGGFFTENKKARFVVPAPVAERRSDDFPLVLNTGRIRDHWHTMTRTGKSPRLSQHLAEPFAEIHPEDAARYGIDDADIVWVTTAHGAILVRALLTRRQRRGAIFVPMHWTDQFSARARVDSLVPALTDPHSGQPASKNVPARISRFSAGVYGFAVLREKPQRMIADYWSIARCDGGWRVELAMAGEIANPAQFAADLFGVESNETIAYRDERAGQHRFAAFAGERLVGALFLAREPVAVSRNWAAEQLETEFADLRKRYGIVAGKPGSGAEDRGAIVCSCFGVGARQIAVAAANGCRTVTAIGESLQAGTNCGSCRAEIRGIIEASQLQAAE